MSGGAATQKTRLLLIGDHGRNTGFERVVRGIATHLHERGDYDVTVRGIGYEPAYSVREYPYRVKSLGATYEDPMGFLNAASWFEEDRPDVVLTVHDLWQTCLYMCRKPEAVPAVTYFPIDAPNVAYSHALTLGAISEAVAYTQFGARETAAGVRDAVDVLRANQASLAGDQLLAWFEVPRGSERAVLRGRYDRLGRWQNPDDFNVIPHGHDHALYEPMDKAWCRKRLGLPADAFIVLNVGTNQFRKRQDLTMRAFAKLARVRKDALLVLHCAGNDMRAGWDLSQLARLYGIHDRVVYGELTWGEPKEHSMKVLYSAADVHINTSGGEGWSLCSAAAAACGVPELVPDWSATRELYADYGVLLPVKDYRIEPRGLNTAHACVDAERTGDILIELAENPLRREALGLAALEFAAKQKTWDEVGDAFHQVIQHALAEPETAGVSYDELYAMRRGVVVSEVAER